MAVVGSPQEDDGQTHSSSRVNEGGKRRPWRVWVLAGMLVALLGLSFYRLETKHAPGCPFYRPSTGKLLIAHGGGGLPNRMYPNSIEALDRSYANGLRIFEMDFHELPFGLIRAGHDQSDLADPRSAWISDVFDWMRRHPGTRLVVDMKTDNLSALQLIAQAAPDLSQRIIPYVYRREEYEPVRALGFARPIYALFPGNPDGDVVGVANGHDFAAVALGEGQLGLIPRINKPVIVFTYDVMVKAPGARGVITNCMMPARGSAALPPIDFLK